jgi:hypothetical protein
MRGYLTENDLREMLRKRVNGRSQSELAKIIGIPDSFLSVMLGGGPINGKVVTYLGYKKVRTKFFERAK